MVESRLVCEGRREERAWVAEQSRAAVGGQSEPVCCVWFALGELWFQEAVVIKEVEKETGWWKMGGESLDARRG